MESDLLKLPVMKPKLLIIFCLLFLSSVAFSQNIQLQKNSTFPGQAYKDGCVGYFNNAANSANVAGQGDMIYASSDSSAFLKINEAFAEFKLIDRSEKGAPKEYSVYKSGSKTLRIDVAKAQVSDDNVALTGTLTLIEDGKVISLAIIGGYSC